MSEKLKVLCIDDSNRPNEIPLSKWVEKNRIYTVKKFWTMRMQPGLVGLELEEIDLTDCFPYQYFISSRFVPVQEITGTIYEYAKEQGEITELV